MSSTEQEIGSTFEETCSDTGSTCDDSGSSAGDCYWTEEDMQLLLDGILEQLPENDEHSFKERSLNWSKISFDKYDSKICESKWREILDCLMHQRTTKEMVNDAINRLSDNRLFGDPYPALASHLYLDDVWESVRAKIPTYTDPQLKQHILAQYTLISRAEKKPYIEEHAARVKEYREREKARLNKKCPTMRTPFMCYIDEKKKKHLEADEKALRKKYRGKFHKLSDRKKLPYIDMALEAEPQYQADEKALRKKYRGKFHKLSDRKKLPYIDMALEAEPQYQEDLKEYCDLNPCYKPPKVRCLTKGENAIKMLSTGKPKLVGFFIQDFRKANKMSNSTIFLEASKEWKNIDEETKGKYKHIAAEAKEKYDQEYKEYLSKLTPEEKTNLEVSKKKSKVSKLKMKKPKTKFPNQPKKPQTNLHDFYTLYKMNKKALPRTGGFSHLNKQFKNLTEKQKAKYNRKMKKEMERYPEKLAKFKALLTPRDLTRFEAELRGDFHSDTDTKDKVKKLKRKKSDDGVGSSLSKKKRSYDDRVVFTQKSGRKSTHSRSSSSGRNGSSDSSSDEESHTQTLQKKNIQSKTISNSQVNNKQKPRPKSTCSSSSSNNSSGSSSDGGNLIYELETEHDVYPVKTKHGK